MNSEIRDPTFDIRVIPCIDLMGGKVVQLIQGQKKALELDSVDDALRMFVDFPLIHVIDLDAALGRGDNAALVRDIAERVPVRVGGGVRSVERAKEVIDIGAQQVIVGSAAFTQRGLNTRFLDDLTQAVDASRIIVAIDLKQGRIAVKGWQETIDLTPQDVLKELEPYCAGFLCTNVDREGMLQGTDVAFFQRLKSETEKTLIAAGGITTEDEVRRLADSGIQVALGMAVYTGKLNLESLRQLNAPSPKGGGASL